MFLSSSLYLLATVSTGLGITLNTKFTKLSLLQILLVISVSGLFFPVAILYILAILTIHSKIGFLLIWALSVSFIFWLSYRKHAFKQLVKLIKSTNFPSWQKIGIHAIILIIFFGYYNKPSEWIISTGMDAANYVIQAAYQVDHPSLYFEDDITRKYKEIFPDAAYKTNSTYAFFPTFAFPPINKIFLSVAMMFNLSLSFYVHLFLAVVAYLSISILAEYCFNNYLMHLIVPISAVSAPVFILYSTIPMSEMCMLATLLSSIAVFYIAYDVESVSLSIIAGVLLGALFGIRLEAIVLYVSFLTVLFTILLLTDEIAKQKILFFMIVVTIMSGILFWYPAVGSGEWYYKKHLKGVLSVNNYLFPCLLLLLSFMFFLRAKIRSYTQRIRPKILGKPTSYTLGTILVIVLTCLICLRFIAPDELISYLSQYGKNIRRLFYVKDLKLLIGYTNPLFVFLSILGTGIIFFTRKYRLYPIIIILIGLSAIFLVNPKHANTHFWQVRRYLVSVFPFIIFSSSAFIDWGLTRVQSKKYVYYVFVVLWCLGIGYFAYQHNIKTHSHSKRYFVGSTDRFLAHSKLFSPKLDVLVMNGDAKIADGYMLAMTYLFGIETISPKFNTITDDQIKRFISYILNQGKNVIFCNLTSGQKLRLENLCIIEKSYEGDVPEIGNVLFWKVVELK